MMSQLELWTEQDSVALQYHEQVIEKGLETFYEVGQSLMFIRENRLYRKEFKTFEEYCQEKWGKKRRWADQLIKASDVVGILENESNCAQKPETESQARPLTKLETPEQQTEAWENAVANTRQKSGQPTAKEVEAEVEKLREQLLQKDSTINQLTQANRFVSSQLDEKKELIKQIEANLQQMALSSANAIADSKVKEATEKLRNELTELKREKKRLESAKTEAESSLENAKKAHAKALEDFKANPDPDTKAKKEQLEREANKAQSELDTTKAELNRLHLQLEDLKTKENHAVSVSITLCAFHKAFKKFMADNTDAIIAMSSPYLDGRQQAEIEALAATLADWSDRVRDSLDNLRGQSSRAVDVEVIQPVRYFPEPEDEEDF